jgi:UDP-N-acetylmuramoylalanine--D-glutamate ligase
MAQGSMDELAGKRLVILGLARQGMALARFASNAGAEVVVSDLRKRSQLQESIDSLVGLDINYVFGEHPMSLLEGTDILAISGGVPSDIPLVKAARAQGIVVSNDSQEFIRRTPATCIGITGSAGKTTTTALTGAIGRASGRKTWIGGNIGRPLIAELEAMQPGDLVVQELSSFQLEVWQHSPPIAAVLNITPNHLDRHKSMAVYSDAKANILRYQNGNGIAVLSADDPGSLALAPLVRGRLRFFSLKQDVQDGAFVHNGRIWLRSNSNKEVAVCALEDLKLRGQHNIVNVCAAVTLADSAGILVEAMADAIRNFRGVEHRLEIVATIDGVEYINDSIATAPERSLAAIDSFDKPLILLAGGKDKDMVWDSWARRVNQRVKHVVLFGQLADFLAKQLAVTRNAGNARAMQSRAANLEEAVKIASSVAVSGDVVLLAPGGTSYDAYDDFAARGEHFRNLVKNVAERHSYFLATRGT